MKYSTIKELHPEGTQYITLNDHEVPSVYSDVEQEYNTIRNHIGLIDGNGFALLQITGGNEIEFVNSLISKDISFLNPGMVCEAIMLRENATPIAIVYILNTPSGLLLLAPPENAAETCQWIFAHQEDGVEIKDLSNEKSLIFIEGEKSWCVAAKVFSFPIETLALRTFSTVQFEEDSDVILSRIGRSGEYAYCIIASHETILHLSMHLLQEKDTPISLCGSSAMDICMLEVSQPIICEETVSAGTLFELGYQWFTQYDKEDYIGAEKLKEQFEAERQLHAVGFKSEDQEAILPGATVYLEDEQVGNVLLAKNDPALKGTLGIAMLQTCVAVSGIPLSVRCGEKHSSIMTISSPFVRPHSWDSQME